MEQHAYLPLQNGIQKDIVQKITYVERIPPAALQGVVYCFWTLKTNQPLDKDFSYTVLPDACIDIVFDATDATEPIIMTPKLAVETITLGRQFHYIGIRFRPGVFSNDMHIKDIVGSQKSLHAMVGSRINLSGLHLHGKTEHAQYNLLEQLAQNMQTVGIVARNTFIENVIRGLQYGLSVQDIAEKSGCSERQLRRKVASQTGYSPVQLRRVVRFQWVLSRGDPLLRFADQSHIIKEFKAVTGLSYNSFTSMFGDGRKVQ